MAAVGRLEPPGGGVGAATGPDSGCGSRGVLGPPAEPLQHRNGDPGPFCMCLHLGPCDSSMYE